MASTVFILPGLYNSGPDHWQTHWENKYGFIRILQKDWETPVCDDWIKTIDEKISEHNPEDVVLIGHSLGCCTIIKWAQQYKRVIKAALLVAPSDTEAPGYPSGTSGFTPMPLYTLPFPSIVIASSNDEYVSIERATHFAHHWGSKFVNAGDVGHINSATNLEDWPFGYSILETLIKA